MSLYFFLFILNSLHIEVCLGKELGMLELVRLLDIDFSSYPGFEWTETPGCHTTQPSCRDIGDLVWWDKGLQLFVKR